MWVWIGLMACSGPPNLELVRPAGTIAGSFRVDVSSDGTEVVWWADGAKPRPVVDGEFKVDTSGWPDGDHKVTVRATRWPGPAVEQQFTITSDNTGPAVSIAERSLEVEQGHTLPVVFRIEEPAVSLRLAVLDRERTAFEQAPGVWRALVGVPIRQQPGRYPIEIETVDSLGNHAIYRPEFEVKAVEWETSGKLPLSKREAQVDPPAMLKMREERDAVYATILPRQWWTGLFGIPVYRGKHTSAFGTFREYPDGERSHHDAQDIARRRGVPIYAANDGMIGLAHAQEVHGNAVLIEHGQKVVSLYSHLRTLLATEGQMVKKGDKIGTMGSTGRSTGPHLHWGIVVDEVPVDPMQWVNEDFGVDSFAEFTRLEPTR